MKILFLLMLIGGFILIGFLTAQICEFFLQDDKAQTVKLSFSNFISLYETNPNKWKLFCNTAKYDTFFIVFPFISFYRYKIWFKQKEKQEEKKRKLNNTESFINAYRQDLARQQEEEIKQLEEKIKRLSQPPSLTLAKTPEPIEDTREKFIIKYTGKLPE